jgi:hypothetical protein
MNQYGHGGRLYAVINGELYVRLESAPTSSEMGPRYRLEWVMPQELGLMTRATLFEERGTLCGLCMAWALARGCQEFRV